MSRGAVMVMAGGTGGHVFPALAVARHLSSEGWSVFWLGTRTGLEARIIPAEPYDIEWVRVSGLRGKSLAARLVAPFSLMRALWQSVRIIRRRRPAVVLGMGGYVSGPGGIAAWLTGRPLVIHEQNSIAGLTNRILGRFASQILTGFPGVMTNGEWTGNPVRDDIAALPEPGQRMQGRTGRLRVLVLGGSQGARAINDAIVGAISLLPADSRPEVRHQCGAALTVEATAAWAACGVDVMPVAFIEDMAEAYAWADLVLGRAGALTVAELAAAGVGSLLVPYPLAVDDHQTRNAKFLADAGAAEVIPQAELDSRKLATRLQTLMNDRSQVLRMAQAARAVACPQATEKLAAACVAAAGSRP